MTAVTNWPSTRLRSGLGMMARMISESVCCSTCGSVKFQTPGCGIVLAVREPQADIDLDQPAALLAARLADGLEVAHAHRKQHIDRILADDGRQHAACRIDEIADGEGGAADAAVDRRADVGVVEIELGLLERRLQLHDLALGGVERRLVLVDLALRTELALRQVEVAVVLELGVDRARPRRRRDFPWPARPPPRTAPSRSGRAGRPS